MLGITTRWPSSGLIAITLLEDTRAGLNEDVISTCQIATLYLSGYTGLVLLCRVFEKVIIAFRCYNGRQANLMFLLTLSLATETD